MALPKIYQYDVPASLCFDTDLTVTEAIEMHKAMKVALKSSVRKKEIRSAIMKIEMAIYNSQRLFYTSEDTAELVPFTTRFYKKFKMLG